MSFGDKIAEKIEGLFCRGKDSVIMEPNFPTTNRIPEQSVGTNPVQDGTQGDSMANNSVENNNPVATSPEPSKAA